MLPQRKQFVPVSPEGKDPEIGTDWASEADTQKATFKHLDDASDNIWITGPTQIWENFTKLVKISVELSSVIRPRQTSTLAFMGNFASSFQI